MHADDSYSHCENVFSFSLLCRLSPTREDDSALFVSLDVVGLIARLEKSNKWVKFLIHEFTSIAS